MRTGKFITKSYVLCRSLNKLKIKCTVIYLERNFPVIISILYIRKGIAADLNRSQIFNFELVVQI